MKRNKLSILLLALFAGFFASCNDDTENFDNRIFVDASVKTSTVLLKNKVSETESSFQLAMSKVEDRDIHVTMKPDMSLVSTYNAAYYDEAVALPDANFKLETTDVVIPKGGTLSTEVKIKFVNMKSLDREKVYVLPVTMERADVGILESARTMYFIVKGAALINVVADLTKNLVAVDWKKPEVANNLRQLTAEALINVSKFDKMLTSVMGIEGYFLIRIGDDGIPQNQLQVDTKKGKLSSADLAIPTDEWTHIAVTYDADAAGRIVVYINGQKKLEGNKDCGAINWAQTHTNEGNGFWIGHSYDRNRWLEGSISECRIWNKVLTADELNERDHFYQVEPDAEGLVSYWKFDEGAGTSIKDYTGNGNDATALEAITWKPVELPAKSE